MHVHLTRTGPLLRLALALAALLAAAAVAGGAEWYAAPSGTAKAKGTRAAPLEIEAALCNPQAKPGDTVYLLGGTYRRRPAEQFTIRLIGKEGQPIQIRPVPGERAIIDGGVSFQNPSAHV